MGLINSVLNKETDHGDRSRRNEPEIQTQTMKSKEETPDSAADAALLVLGILGAGMYYLLKSSKEEDSATPSYRAKRSTKVHFSNLHNNHDHKKIPHPSKESAEKEVERMRRRKYQGSDKLNSYYNSDREQWFVGRRRY